jgi:ATP-binding protein involved in chromosome partitioning
VVENMSWWEQPDGSRVELFGAGGGSALAQSLSTLTGAKVPLLGQVPIDQRLREGGDQGVPIVASAPQSPAAVALAGIADTLAGRQRGLAGLQLGLSPAGR